MSLLVVVLAHVQETVDLHMPYWEAHGAELWVVCPEDRHIETGHRLIKTGKACHEGAESHKRMMEVVRQIMMYQYMDHVIIYEHDSICLDVKSIPWKRGFFGNVFGSVDKDFLAPRYSNPPWIIDMGSLDLMWQAQEKWDLYEQGFNDRILAAMAHVAGVPILDHIPKGYTAGTLNWYDDGWGVIRTIGRGGTMFHGIKDRAMLNKIEEVYANRDILRTLGHFQG